MLGIVSLCMDLSSDIIHGLLPVFLVSTLGASIVMLGLIEGVSDAVTSFVKLFSGALSDLWGRRKALVVAGYGFAALVKPLFNLLPTGRAWCSPPVSSTAAARGCAARPATR